jgi:hypothetical protein
LYHSTYQSSTLSYYIQSKLTKKVVTLDLIPPVHHI